MTLYNLTANNNGYAGDYGGALLRNDYDAAKQMAVTLNGYNMFNDNSFSGLTVLSFGAVALNNVTAVDNGHGVEDVYGYGADIQNGGGTYAKAVAIKGINIFSGSDSIGLFVSSDGAISISKTTANGNDGTGVSLDNSTSSVNSGVSISGYLTANDNGPAGLEILTRGAVIAAYLTANGNFYGALIQNDYSTTVQMPVTLTGVSTFIGNGNTGLQINSRGVITLNNITALNNGLAAVDGSGSGVDIVNAGGVLPKAVYVKGVNTFSGNDEAGLTVTSYGVISITKPTSDGNGMVGVYLDNDNGLVQSNVTISGYGVFNGNGAWGGTGDGLEVWSHGAITLTNITSQFNKGYGAALNTIGLTTVHAVTLTGTNSFNYNGDSGSEAGVSINADGNITISNLTANYNYYWGADLDNYTNWATNSFASFGSIFINGFGNFVGNVNGVGIVILTHGNITLNRVTANGNGWDGFSLWAGIGLGGTGYVTIVCSSAYGNGNNGLFVSTPGIVTLKGFLAYGNPDDEDIGGNLAPRATCP